MRIKSLPSRQAISGGESAVDTDVYRRLLMISHLSRVLILHPDHNHQLSVVQEEKLAGFDLCHLARQRKKAKTYRVWVLQGICPTTPVLHARMEARSVSQACELALSTPGLHVGQSMLVASSARRPRQVGLLVWQWDQTRTISSPLEHCRC